MNPSENTDLRILDQEGEALIRNIESPLHSSPWAWGPLLFLGFSFILPGRVVATPLFVFWVYLFVLLADRAVAKKRARAIIKWIELQKTQGKPQS